ncbi:uncharacterized protein P884DRAFT_264702 [Thermothelomyces heterothallicus CBS 202.75]|uniref:uncharacterized protein n=1 Tax=Thermothelomyces heterothallicus CBS 202.75 TaxID=1149848 RepID=UPI003742E328
MEKRQSIVLLVVWLCWWMGLGKLVGTRRSFVFPLFPHDDRQGMHVLFFFLFWISNGSFCITDLSI